MILDRFRLDGRVAVVTGAARGIGLATARALGEAGGRLALADRDREGCAAAADALRAEGIDAVPVPLDVADPAAVEAAVAGLAARLGRIDVLVNNAGVGSLSAALDLPEAEWRRVMAINADAVFWCARAFGRAMVARGSGSIVNVGSMSGTIVNRGFAAAHYMASKAAVHQITRALAVEWAGSGVRVNAVAPGYTATSQTEGLRARPEILATCLETTPMGRFAQPEEIAAAVLFLASDAASYCTGTILAVDGGHTCW